jgi:hypothetical protein
VEEFFRDAGSVRNGPALRHTQVRRVDRLGRLVLVLADLPLTGLGLRAPGRGAWSSTDRGRPGGTAGAGRAVRGWARLSPQAALAVILAATILASPS